jgi:hypothetical protein
MNHDKAARRLKPDDPESTLDTKSEADVAKLCVSIQGNLVL